MDCVTGGLREFVGIATHDLAQVPEPEPIDPLGGALSFRAMNARFCGSSSSHRRFVDQYFAADPATNARGALDAVRSSYGVRRPAGRRAFNSVNSTKSSCGRAAADAIEFAHNQFERVDCGGVISLFESGEGARYRWHQGTGWITVVAGDDVRSSPSAADRGARA